jgi:type IV secretion system protein VirD4
MSCLVLGRSTSSSRTIGFPSHERAISSELILYEGDGHLITIAPTGTGKTSGPVVCNALTHPGQLIVIDIKGEVHKATAKVRSDIGQEVHVLDMRDDDPLPGSLNPLDLAARSGTDIAAVARSFSSELVERGVEERDRFWSDWADIMVTAGLAWLLADEPPAERRLSALFNLLYADNLPYRLAVMLDQRKDLNPTTKAAFCAFINLPEVTRACVLGVTQTHLRLFDSKIVRRLTDTTSFDLDAFIAGAPMSLYIIVPPLRLTAYRPLLRMWLSGLILAMTQRKPPPKERTLMLVDEAGNIGKIDALLTAATLLRSWGLTLWTFWQNAAQLSIYGAQAHTLVDNAAIVQVFGARNHRMAQDIANLIGGVSPDEILKMKSDEQILLVEGKLTRATQVRHYNDKSFRGAEKS